MINLNDEFGKNKIVRNIKAQHKKLQYDMEKRKITLKLKQHFFI